MTNELPVLLAPPPGLAVSPASSRGVGAVARLRDNHGRTLTDLRVSVTERCNYRCVYCRSGEEGLGGTDLPLVDLARMVRVLVSLGIEKVRLTGGEPLLRKGIVDLVAETAALRTVSGARLDLALTTNGHLLAGLAGPLAAAGLNRVTVSMDAVEPAVFEQVTRVPGSFGRVLDGVRAAQAAGLGPVKVNCVLLRGINDSQIEAFAEFSRAEGVIVRFIEWMPLEEDRTWTLASVVPMREIVARLNAVRPLRALPPQHASETARRFTFNDGVGEIGIIAPVSEPFCNHCSRLRLTADGKLRTCLFSQSDHDLYRRLRQGASDDELAAYIRDVAAQKEARHHIGEAGFLKPARNMVRIGG